MKKERVHQEKVPTIEPRLLTIDDMVRYTNISKQTIYNSRSPKSNSKFPIQGRKIGGRLLWDKREVDAYLDGVFAKEETPRKGASA